MRGLYGLIVPTDRALLDMGSECFSVWLTWSVAFFGLLYAHDGRFVMTVRARHASGLAGCRVLGGNEESQSISTSIDLVPRV